MGRAVALCSLFALVALANPRIAAAHDFWLYPSTHRAAPSDSLDVRICFGVPTAVEDLERTPSHVKRFELHIQRGVVTVPGAVGANPAGTIALAGASDEIATVVYESTPNFVELEARKFENYLVEEGLLDIIADRQRRGEGEAAASDAFIRYAKALVQIGEGTVGFDRRVGLAAELVATANPFAGELEFQVWYLDRPHAGARVDLFRVDAQAIELIDHATSDREGRVHFRGQGRGRFLVATTTMRRASYPLQADWESSWASITFEVAESPKSRRAWWFVALGVAVVAAGWLLLRRRGQRR
jgi:uncharacterized GH25 family protein